MSRDSAMRYTAAMSATVDHALERDAMCAGWSGELALDYERRGSRTVLDRQLHRGPLLVQKSLYPEGDAVSEHLDWRRTVVPSDEARSKPWEPVARRQYDSEGLLATAREEAEGA